jgi:hypothetical protein
MKINELFEAQQDEGIGSALGKVAGAVGKGVGSVVGGARALGSAAKAGYKAGSAGAQQSILGQTFPDVSLNPNGQTPAGQQGNQTQQGNAPAGGQQQNAPAQQGNAPAQQGNAPAEQPGTAPAASSQAAPQEFPKKANGSTMNFNPDTGEKFKTPAEAQAYLDAAIAKNPNYGQPQSGQQAPAGEQGKVEPTMDPAQGQQAPAGNQQAAEEPAEAPAMKSAEITSALDTVWKKATANQGSMTGSPQVQQQIIGMAKAAGLAGRKIEGRQFYSKFLKQNI